MAGRNGKNGGRNGADPAGGADDEDDDAPVTRAELTDLVNAAVTGQISRKLTPIQRQLEAMPQMITDGVTAAVTAAMGAGGDPQQRRQGQQQGQGKDGQQADPRLDEMATTIKDLQAKLTAQNTATAAAERRARETARDNAINEHLTALGVEKHRMRGAAAVMREQLHEVKDASAPGGYRYVFKAKRDGFEEEQDIGAGIAEWGKTDEGKSYLGATPAARGGSGMRPGQGQGQGQGAGSGRGVPQDPAAAKAAKQQAALDSLVAGLQGATIGGPGGTVDLGDA